MQPNPDPLIRTLQSRQPLCWHNTQLAPFAQAHADCPFDADDVAAAAARLQRFAPCIRALFPETDTGVIESPLRRTPTLQQHAHGAGKLWVKCDGELPISGSVKARGGIYEVLCHAEKVALHHGVLANSEDDYAKLATAPARAVFSQYCIAVGSTGNLGLSIGIMAAKLGFQAAVHMSADAQDWKKQLLREAGAQVFEYAGDYGAAVAAGRQLAENDPQTYFVDDEQSPRLFLGYAVAGERLKAQLDAAGVAVSRERPLYVYLPCGVGGAPGGIAFGLKLVFGDAVRCVFVEPVDVPCMLLGVYTGKHEQISVRDIGLSGETLADGLAVARPSGLVGRAVGRMIEAFVTVADDDLLQWLARAHRDEGLKLEPSACAGLAAWQHFAEDDAVHIVWATGGGMMPDGIFADYLAQA
ncbi:D-serine ammonia-lyase [Conchiformibius steedae]|uniref:D-serine ammonia-lyase n=1 Tax=Conchiformibius steedae TaxID=153493 RepID=UPI0026EFF910|nr:D-serine ammonia-lyase [Conchiformibius steedae]